MNSNSFYCGTQNDHDSFSHNTIMSSVLLKFFYGVLLLLFYPLFLSLICSSYCLCSLYGKAQREHSAEFLFLSSTVEYECQMRLGTLRFSGDFCKILLPEILCSGLYLFILFHLYFHSISCMRLDSPRRLW